MSRSGPWRPEDATPPNGERPPEAGEPPTGDGAPPPGAGREKSGGSKGLIAGAIAVVALVVLGLAVFVGLRLGGDDSDEELIAEAGGETTSEQADARAAECEEALIGAEGVTRVIDCGDGWAVLEREGANEPYWVTYRDGGWTTVNNDVRYVMTCDEALAHGVPAWMAARYVSNCTPAGDLQPPVQHAGEQRPPADVPADNPGAPAPPPDPAAPPAGGNAPPPPNMNHVPFDPSGMEAVPRMPDLSRQPQASEVRPPFVPAPGNPISPVLPAPEFTRVMPNPPAINGPNLQVEPSKTPRLPRP